MDRIEAMEEYAGTLGYSSIDYAIWVTFDENGRNFQRIGIQGILDFRDKL